MQAIFEDAGVGHHVDSAAFRQRAPRTWLSDDPDTATEQTVQEMCRQIHTAAADALVRAYAVKAVEEFRGGPAWAGAGIDPFSSPQCVADSCWWWCKHNLRFRNHGEQFELWSRELGDPRTKLQLLISPDVLVRMRSMEGDCAIYTMMLCAMLDACGVPFQILTLAVDPMQPTVFSHVCARAAGETLDASHGDYPGWQVPARDINRAWLFDGSSGRRVDDAPKFAGLHAYRRPGVMMGMGRRGMGATVCDDFGCYDDGTGALVSSAGAGQQAASSSGSTPGQFIDYTTGTVYPTSATVTAPSQNSAQWASFASNLLKSGLTLAEINSIQPGTVVSANGAILRQNPGYSVPATGTASLNLGSSNTILYIGLAAAAIFALSMLKK